MLRRDGGTVRARTRRSPTPASWVCRSPPIPHEIAAFLRRRSGPRVVFSTYQSSPQIAAAFALGRVPAFDLVIADEAHRVAGIESSDFATVLDADGDQGAAAVVHDGDPALLHGSGAEGGAGSRPGGRLDGRPGQVRRRCSTGSRSVRRSSAKLLTDYQVAVVGVDDATYREWAEKGTLVTRDGNKITDARTLAGQIGLAKAMRKYDLRRIITLPLPRRPCPRVRRRDARSHRSGCLPASARRARCGPATPPVR